jgi:hypothetical protein
MSPAKNNDYYVMFRAFTFFTGDRDLMTTHDVPIFRIASFYANSFLKF